ncbi:MAG: alpha/beta fold hydrolase [Oscillospiraceae bacterium]
MIKTNKKLKIVLISFIVLILAFIILSYIYVSDYYIAEDIVLETMSNNTQSIDVKDNLTILSPTVPSDTAIIFYPGGKVEHTSYLPILDKLRQSQITTVLVEMPFNLALFDVNAADDIYDKMPHIKNWYIGGHSLGGAMASNYASKNKDKVNGLILLGATIYKDYPEEDALTVYGTFNSNLEKNINYTKNIVVIDGGNHAQFGNYGKQKGDPDATITTEEQQNIAVDSIVKFIEEKTRN